MNLAQMAREGERLLFEKRFPSVDVATPDDEPDAGTAPWHERHRHDRYKYNRIRYGCSLHGILPSRGPDKCVFAGRCDFASNSRLQWHCKVGYPCPAETERYIAFVHSARWEYRRALHWTDDDTYDDLIHHLALFDLQKVRCSVRSRDEARLRRVLRKRPDGNYEEVMAPTLSGRYTTAVHRPSLRILNRLLHDPRPQPSQDPLPDIMRFQQVIELRSMQGAYGPRTPNNPRASGRGDC